MRYDFSMTLTYRVLRNVYFLTSRLSCQGKSETLGIPVGRDEMGYYYPVGDLDTLCRESPTC